MLTEKKITFTYREYKQNPLSIEELRTLFSILKQPAHTLLRKRDPAYAALDLHGDEPDEVLFAHFATHPTLMERPVFMHNEKAVVCRPYDRLLEIL